MSKKKTEQAEKWIATAPVHRRGASYEDGDDITEAALAAPQWAQRLLDAGKARKDLVNVPVVEVVDDPPPEESTEPDEAELGDVDHPPD